MKKIFLFYLIFTAAIALNIIIIPNQDQLLAQIPAGNGTPTGSIDDECSESISAGVKCFGATAFGQEEAPDLAVVIAGIINILLMLLGLIFLVLIIYGGFTWMTAMGQDEKIKKAKQTITNAAIGLIIILISYGVVSFIFYLLYESDIFS